MARMLRRNFKNSRYRCKYCGEGENPYGRAAEKVMWMRDTFREMLNRDSDLESDTVEEPY